MGRGPSYPIAPVSILIDGAFSVVDGDELDDLPLADEAKLECASKTASLRGTSRSNYLRRAVLKVARGKRNSQRARWLWLEG